MTVPIKKVADKARRRFLKLMPAAPLAAPSIAQKVMMTGDVPTLLPKGGGIYSAGTVDPSWLATRRAELEAAARGEFSAEDEMYLKPRTDLTTALHFDSLRSLSPVMRAHLHARDVAQRARQERQMFASFELKHFIKKNFGGLG